MLNDIYQGIDPVAFSFGPISVRWYGIAYVLGFALAALVVWRTARRWRVKVDVDSLATIMFCVIVGVIAGGRLGYVLFYGDGFYLAHPEKILATNEGGMSFHGGLVGALLAGIVAAKITRIPYLTLADLGCIGAPLGLFFRPLRELRERRAVGRSHGRAVGRGVRRRRGPDGAASLSALRGAA